LKTCANGAPQAPDHDLYRAVGARYSDVSIERWERSGQRDVVLREVVDDGVDRQLLEMVPTGCSVPIITKLACESMARSIRAFA
jgi:hypothetical protein